MHVRYARSAAFLLLALSATAVAAQQWTSDTYGLKPNATTYNVGIGTSPTQYNRLTLFGYGMNSQLRLSGSNGENAMTLYADSTNSILSFGAELSQGAWYVRDAPAGFLAKQGSAIRFFKMNGANGTSGGTQEFAFSLDLDKLWFGVGVLDPAYTMHVRGTKTQHHAQLVLEGPSATQHAILWANAGSGTQSSNQAYVRLTASASSSKTWETGMRGSHAYEIADDVTHASHSRTMVSIARETRSWGTDPDTQNVPVAVTTIGGLAGLPSPPYDDASDEALSTLPVVLRVNGSAEVAGRITATYQDVAEWVPTLGALEPGTVVVVAPDRKNVVMASSEAYDTRVAGVVSEQPGLLLGVSSDKKAPIATLGRVRVLVDASERPIRAGDILVTSAKPGRAMKSEPLEINGRKFHQPGTVIGKALEPLASGQGRILVLLSLQ